ncbi:MAG: polysaccharide lyase family 7 protein [Paraglaciecola sp.]|uniref:polysaccharide lyase family 7 protein n=1 Tax=Paraglaciecola sp. TaxID=1920173 RepID=UPI003298E12B
MKFITQKKYLYLSLTTALSIASTANVNAATVTIANPGFESSFDGWTDDDPSAISSDSHSGSKSAKITGSGGRVDQTVTLTPNTNYVLTAYVEGSGEVGINLGSSTESTKSTSDDWSEVTVSFNSGSATSGEIFGKYYNDEGRFDDFTLESTSTSPGSDTGTDGELSISTAFDDGTSHSNYPPSNAIDGSSAWASRWAASLGSNATNLTLELEEVQNVKQVGISWGRGDSRSHTFEIYARPGTSGNWTKIADTVSSGNSTDIELYDVTDFDAQQVRVKAQSNSAGSSWMNITEVKLYGENGSANNDDDDDNNNDNGGGDNSDGNECQASGKMLYNGSCVEYSEVYEAEHGEIGEDDHIISLSPIEMKFDALAAQHVTENGNGWRHELKIKSSGGYRVGMTELYEEFKAKITANLDPGAKTIVAQHHADTTATITKLYIADLDEGGFENAPDGTESDSVAMNGIFDVYIRLAKEDGSGETKHLLTTIRSGDSFNFEEINDHGTVTVKINGQSLNPITVNDSSASYFKFGNYQQAQNPETNDKLASGDGDGDWADFFSEYFDVSEIIFTEMSYTRTLD